MINNPIPLKEVIPEDLSKHSVLQLKNLLLSRNESIVGSKETLIKRLNNLRELELLANDNEIISDEELETNNNINNINNNNNNNNNNHNNGIIEMEQGEGEEQQINNGVEQQSQVDLVVDEEKRKQLENLENEIYQDDSNDNNSGSNGNGNTNNGNDYENDEDDSDQNVNNDEIDEQAIMDQLLGQQSYQNHDNDDNNSSSTSSSSNTEKVESKKESNNIKSPSTTTPSNITNNNNVNIKNDQPTTTVKDQTQQKSTTSTSSSGKTTPPIKKEIDKNKVIADLKEMEESFKRKPLIKISGLNDTISEKEIQEYLTTVSPVHSITYDCVPSKKDAVVVLADNPPLIVEKLNQTKLKTQTLSISEIAATEHLLYVGNLPSEITKEQIRKLFEKFGEIDRIIIIRNKISAESKGYCFVDFRTKYQANSAKIAIHNTMFNRRSLRVDWASESCTTLESMHSKSILIDKLPKFLADWNRFKKIFGTFGKIKDINILPHPRGGNAFIDYETVDEAEKAQLLMNEKEVQGYKLRVSFGNPGKSGSTLLQKPQGNHQGNHQQGNHQQNQNRNRNQSGNQHHGQHHQPNQHPHHHHPYQQPPHHPHPIQPGNFNPNNSKPFRGGGGFRNQQNQNQNHGNINPSYQYPPHIYQNIHHPQQNYPPQNTGYHNEPHHHPSQQPIPNRHQPPPTTAQPPITPTTTNSTYPYGGNPVVPNVYVPTTPTTPLPQQPQIPTQPSTNQQQILFAQQQYYNNKIQMMEMTIQSQKDQLMKATNQSQKEKAIIKQQQQKLKQQHPQQQQQQQQKPHHQQTQPPHQIQHHHHPTQHQVPHQQPTHPQQPTNNYYYKNPATSHHAPNNQITTPVVPTQPTTPTPNASTSAATSNSGYPANWQQYYAQYYAQNPEAYWQQYYQNAAYAGYSQQDLSAYYASYMQQGHTDPSANTGQKQGGYSANQSTNQSHHDNKRGRQH